MDKEDFFLLIASVTTFYKNLILDSSSDESESDDEEIIFNILNEKIYNNILKDLQKSFLTTIENFSSKEFKQNFRLSKRSYIFLLNRIKPILLRKQGGKGRKPTEPFVQVLVTLWFFANIDSYRELKTRFGMPVATASRCIRRVVTALYSIRSDYIKWPDDPQENYERFEELWGFPDTVGAVDGTAINIPLYADGRRFINRKGRASVQLQVVSDHNMKFIHCYTGEVGSTHDQRVFMKSGLQQICNSESYFPNGGHLIGDKAYAIQEHVLVPYKDNGHLTNAQDNYNRILSSSRIVVERAIGLLKCRWRRLLLKLYMLRIDLVPFFIIACCVLHNICIMNNDFYNFMYRRRAKRRLVQNGFISRASKIAGRAKRVQITQNLLLYQ